MKINGIFITKLSVGTSIGLLIILIYSLVSYFQLKTITIDFLLIPSDGYFQYYPVIIALSFSSIILIILGIVVKAYFKNN